MTPIELAKEIRGLLRQVHHCSMPIEEEGQGIFFVSPDGEDSFIVMVDREEK